MYLSIFRTIVGIEYTNETYSWSVKRLDASAIVIDHLLRKYKADQKWTRIAIEQLSDEDIVWRPTPESNSIANLVAHISGALYYWFEVAYFEAPYVDRSNEFDRGLQMTKTQALELLEKSYESAIKVLERIEANPEKLLDQPYRSYPEFNSAGLNNQSTVLEMLLHQFRHLPSHVGQLCYIVKMRKGQIDWG
ncbi:DinB family protein [Paenibacillus koleovorans]|uniref:DinB family protein n=1 Tax=Paenibacillus koleovorans TaxID=121608 RepID=UPI0013E3252C|nr:DinB family protein [Paenibacillus koleovorans]